MDFRQARGFDLKHHAVDPATGDALCGLPQRRLADHLGGLFRANRPKACATCAEKAAATKGRTSARRRGASS